MGKFRIFAVVVTLATVPQVVHPSWEVLDLPTDRGFSAIWAIDEQNIFVVGHHGLWKTFDGDNWTLDTTVGHPSFVYFVDDTLGFVRGDILTTDGGLTWQLGDTVNGVLVKTSISFPDGQSTYGYGTWFLDVCM